MIESEEVQFNLNNTIQQLLSGKYITRKDGVLEAELYLNIFSCNKIERMK